MTLLEALGIQWPLLVAMATLMGFSGFFSCSEAALFSLSRSARDAMRRGTDQERFAESLLHSPDRLLTAILFWNLLINMAYFALASVVSMRIGKVEGAPTWAPEVFALAALLAIIVMSELAPKNLGVLNPRGMAALLSLPLGAATRVLDPILPTLKMLSNASARLLMPKFESEPYLGIEDLERAVELGSGETHDDELLLFQERQVMHRLVDLASATAEELMQPRKRLTVAPPDLALSELDGVQGEYLLLTEPDSEEIAAAVPVNRLPFADPQRLSRGADPVVYAPWCSSGADTLHLLRRKGRRVAAIVNELGETIGIVTLERLLDAVLRDVAHADPDDIHAPRMRLISGGDWEASGATPIRKLAKRVRQQSVPHDPTWAAAAEAFDSVRSVTVGGFLQETLERRPAVGDRVVQGGLEWTVVSGPEHEEPTSADIAPLVVRIRPTNQSEPTSHGPLPPRNNGAGEGES